MRTEDEEEDGARDEEEDACVGDEWRPDLHWLTDRVAVGGCFPTHHATRLAEAHGVRAVIDLRAESCDDEGALRNAGIELLHLPTPDMGPATHEQLEAGVAFVRERIAHGDKVLIHCQHGIGRSALLALCVLVDQGWAPLDALAHVKSRREAVSPSEAQYRSWAAWLQSRTLAAPDYHSFGCIAYRHLSHG